MANEGIKQKIAQYLNTPMPTSALLLRGPWGVGKSYYWDQYTTAGLPGGKKDITFSVAGLITLEEIERALFTASVEPWAPKLAKETGTVLGRALLRWAKIDPNEVKLKADVAAGQTVVCIDDVERFAGDFKVLFGFVLSLLDEEYLHVVLIADEERAAKDLPRYTEYRERIISRAIEVLPSRSDFYESVANGFANEKVRAALLAHRVNALDLFDEKGINNLRIVRSVLDEMNAVLSEVNWPEDGAVSLARIFSAVTFHAVAISKNPLNADLVRRAFLVESIGMAVAMLQRRQAKADSDVAKGNRPVAALIQDLGFESDVALWPRSANFAAYTRGEAYDANKLASEFEVFPGADNGERSLLMQLRETRSLSQEQFHDVSRKFGDKLDSNQFVSLQEIWASFETWLYLAKVRLIDETPEECRARFLKIINSRDGASDIKDDLEIFRIEKDSADDGVISALESLADAIRKYSQAATNKQLLTRIIEGGVEDTHNLHLTPLAGESAAEILGRLSSIGRPAINRMTMFFSRRTKISNIAEYAAADGPVAEQLAAIIENSLPAKGLLSLDQVALNQLAGVLRYFVQIVMPELAHVPGGTAGTGVHGAMEDAGSAEVQDHSVHRP